MAPTTTAWRLTLAGSPLASRAPSPTARSLPADLRMIVPKPPRPEAAAAAFVQVGLRRQRVFLARSLRAPPRAGTKVWERRDPAGLRIAGIPLFRLHDA